MSSSDQKLLCEILFRDFRTNKLLKITGKTDIDKLMSPKKKFVILENNLFQNQQWKKISCKIPKVDIIRICAFKAQVLLNYEKGNLIIDQNQLQEVKGIS
ncbi:MAG: hypothetical protein ACFFBP_01535 [Promethearchaeota archaeon]